MRHVLKASIQTAVLLSLVGVSTGVAGTYYTHYTNYSCQVALTLEAREIASGRVLNYSVAASGYLSGYTTSGPSTTIPVDVLRDGQTIITLNAPWRPYGVTPIGAAITNLAVGAHTIAIQHTNAFEYYSETVFSHSVFHSNPWGADWYDYY